MTQRHGESHVGNGSTSRGIQHIVGLPEANMPGMLILDSVDDSGTIVENSVWIDSNADLRWHTSIPTDQDGQGKVVAYVGAVQALIAPAGGGYVGYQSIVSSANWTSPIYASKAYAAIAAAHSGAFMHAMVAEFKMLHADSAVTTYGSGAAIDWDLGPATTAGDTYGIVVRAGDAGTDRADNPTAFIAFADAESATKPVEYLFDLGINSETLGTPIIAAAGGVLATDCGNAAKALAIRADGTDYWLAVWAAIT